MHTFRDSSIEPMCCCLGHAHVHSGVECFSNDPGFITPLLSKVGLEYMLPATAQLAVVTQQKSTARNATANMPAALASPAAGSGVQPPPVPSPPTAQPTTQGGSSRRALWAILPSALVLLLCLFGLVVYCRIQHMATRQWQARGRSHAYGYTSKGPLGDDVSSRRSSQGYNDQGGAIGTDACDANRKQQVLHASRTTTASSQQTSSVHGRTTFNSGLKSLLSVAFPRSSNELLGVRTKDTLRSIEEAQGADVGTEVDSRSGDEDGMNGLGSKGLCLICWLLGIKHHGHGDDDDHLQHYYPQHYHHHHHHHHHHVRLAGGPSIPAADGGRALGYVGTGSGAAMQMHQLTQVGAHAMGFH